MLISRGDCEFVYKTLNAQKLGAQMAIIMDKEDHKGQIIMVDNGYGSSSSIQATKRQFLQFLLVMKLEKS